MQTFFGSQTKALALSLVGIACVVFAQTTTKPSTTSSSKSSSSSTKKPDFPPHALVLKGYEKVSIIGSKKKPLYTLYTRSKDDQMYAELPASYSSKKYFVALTISSGDRYAGLQSGEMYMYWRRYNNRLAMIVPNITTRSNGDPESKASVKRLFTDRVILDVPIVTMGPSGGPVIDMDALLVTKAYKFFGSGVRSSEFARLHKIKKAKAFEKNVEVGFEIPTSGGKLQTLHYSISEIPDSTGYKPRKADERVGYFTTAYSDLGVYDDEKTKIRFINRWHLEKRDPKLKVSPAKNPIIFYIEHTTPVRYRRWVREGILEWNKAFEKVGISDAIEVYYQDAATGAHMEKDPEDVRYNFVRWLNNDIGTAIGPSRVHPLTGQILDADIILTDGWIRHYRFQFADLLPKIAMEGFSPETMDWLAKNPKWDPRVRLAAPADRANLVRKIQREAMEPGGSHPFTRKKTALLGDDKYDGLYNRVSQVNGMCLAAEGKAFDLAVVRMAFDIAAATAVDDKKDDKKDEKKDEKKEEKKEEKKDKPSVVDGMPESFVGPLLSHLVAHEVGHTLGLRHNFKASSIYSLDEINSKKVKGKVNVASVMDYTPTNIRVEAGTIQGDFATLGIGDYDYWAIEYGYSFAKDLKPILARVAEPKLPFATDEDTYGSDPLARRYDFSKNPLDYAKDQMRLVKYHRGKILSHFVKDGDAWSKSRRGYELTLSMQTRSLSMMANWVGGVFVNRDKKGDKNGRAPLKVVPAEDQRNALKFVIEHAFNDEAYGLTPELLNHMSSSSFSDSISDAMNRNWPVHDKIAGIQSSALTMLMNPSVLRRIYDNEFQVPADQDALTLAELLQSISDAVWKDLNAEVKEKHTARKPLLSSIERNLQREHLDRLIDLTLPGAGSTEAFKPLSNLALTHLREIQKKAQKLTKDGGDKLDPYTKSHLSELDIQIGKALEAQYIYNAKDIGGGGGLGGIFLLKDEDKKSEEDK